MGVKGNDTRRAWGMERGMEQAWNQAWHRWDQAFAVLVMVILLSAKYIIQHWTVVDDEGYS